MVKNIFLRVKFSWFCEFSIVSKILMKNTQKFAHRIFTSGKRKLILYPQNANDYREKTSKICAHVKVPFGREQLHYRLIY